MSGAAAVRQYISTLAGSLVTRRELITRFGSRGAVTNELARLNANGIIRRVAVGVYSIVARRVALEGPLEIAAARCRAFGKSILSGDNDATRRMHQSQTSLVTDGCRTSFNSVHGRIFLRSATPHRLKRTRKESGMAAAIVTSPRTKPYDGTEPTHAVKIRCYRSIWSQKLISMFERAIKTMRCCARKR